MESRVHPPDAPLRGHDVALRLPTEADAPAIARACQDGSIARFIPIPSPYTDEDARAYLDRSRQQWAAGTKATFVIADAATEEDLWGIINLAIAGTTGNCGYWVAPWARRRGVASTALRLISNWAFTEVGLGVVILEIHPDNDASMGVAEAAGFHRAGQIDVNQVTGQAHGLIYARLASDPPPAPTG